MSTVSKSVQVFINKSCPYAHRAFFVATEKQLIGNGVEIVEVSLPTPEWYNKEINIRETVPAIKLPNGRTIPESLIVIEFLEEAFKNTGRKLLPEDPADKADIRTFIKEADSMIGGLYGVLFEKDDEKRAEKWASSKGDLAFIESLLKDKSENGPFYLGETLSLADVAVIPFLDRFSATLKEFRGIDILAEAPRLARILAAAEQLESFKATALPRSDYVNAYRKYLA